MFLEENQLYTFFAVVDQGKGKDGKRVESNGEVFAILVGTLDHRFVLTVHEIHHHRLVPFQVCFPTLLGNHVVRSPVVILSLCVRFVDNSVEIFVQPVQQISDQLA